MSDLHILALRHSAFYSPLLMTMAGGYLHDEGITPHYRPAAPGEDVHRSVADGVAHVAQSAIATAFAPLARGETLPIVHFASINTRDGFFLAGRHPEPDFQWRNLAGKTVLVDHFFQPLAMFKYAAHREGLDVGAVRAADAGGVAEMEAAFRAGHGDYVHLQGPAPQQLEHEGVGFVVAAVGAAVGPVAFSSLCATRAWLSSAQALAFMRAYRRALYHVREASPREIAALEASFFPGVDPLVLEGTIAAYQRLGCWAADPCIARADVEATLDVFTHSGGLARRFGYDEMIVTPPDETPTFLE